jgi:hypothetical protein
MEAAPVITLQFLPRETLRKKSGAAVQGGGGKRQDVGYHRVWHREEERAGEIRNRLGWNVLRDYR